MVFRQAMFDTWHETEARWKEFPGTANKKPRPVQVYHVG